MQYRAASLLVTLHVANLLFAEDTAKKAGKTARTVRNKAKIGAALKPYTEQRSGEQKRKQARHIVLT